MIYLAIKNRCLPYLYEEGGGHSSNNIYLSQIYQKFKKKGGGSTHIYVQCRYMYVKPCLTIALPGNIMPTWNTWTPAVRSKIREFDQHLADLPRRTDLSDDDINENDDDNSDDGHDIHDIIM